MKILKILISFVVIYQNLDRNLRTFDPISPDYSKFDPILRNFIKFDKILFDFLHISFLFNVYLENSLQLLKFVLSSSNFAMRQPNFSQYYKIQFIFT